MEDAKEGKREEKKGKKKSSRDVHTEKMYTEAQD